MCLFTKPNSAFYRVFCIKLKLDWKWPLHPHTVSGLQNKFALCFWPSTLSYRRGSKNATCVFPPQQWIFKLVESLHWKIGNLRHIITCDFILVNVCPVHVSSRVNFIYIASISQITKALRSAQRTTPSILTSDKEKLINNWSFHLYYSHHIPPPVEL